MAHRLFIGLLALLLFSSSALARSSPSLASQARSFPVPPVRAWAAVALDANTGQVLAAVNPHRHLAIASTTKVMTAALALQMGHLSDRITVPSSAFDYEWDATVMGLKPGQQVTLRDLLYGLMLPSGADAANTIAIHYAGSEVRWVALMNQKAVSLGMKDTHYGTPHGLDVPGQYSSAYDLALLGAYASAMPDLVRIASTRTYTWNGHTFSNLNHVVNWYPGADGLKPGFTNAAGLCQLLDARRHGRHVVVAILHTPDMVIDARNLLNFGLRDFTWAQTALPGDKPAMYQTGTDAAGQYIFFPGAGHYVHGKFWQTYVANGSLGSLGYPRTEPLQEGSLRVQYFQNGAIAQSSSGQVSRLALGLTPLPATSPTPTATPAVTPTEVAMPLDASPTATTTRSARATATPAPPSTTPTPTPSPTIDKVFASYGSAHARLLGVPVAPSSKIAGYTVQVFRYGALAYETRTHTTWLLPVGDRLLAARHYLPPYPGNVYPAGFAPRSILKAIHWL